MNDSKETAISVIDEASDCYYSHYESVPKNLRKRISLAMLDSIFEAMVVPTIARVRALDRDH